jgi:hypothetical protein
MGSLGWGHQVLLELSQDSFVQMSPHIGSGDGMGLARINLQVVRNAGLNQFLNVLDGVFEVDVVITGAMRDE